MMISLSFIDISFLQKVLVCRTVHVQFFFFQKGVFVEVCMVQIDIKGGNRGRYFRAVERRLTKLRRRTSTKFDGLRRSLTK